ncbi:MAG: paraquat-inducible membrane protein A [Rhodobacteraceae bacterium]|nr:paraquat-inducible membrane protein A [Paracoccaceae bacterium]
MITARDAGLVACRSCASVWPQDQATCGRCGARLQSRDTGSLQRVWAWWAAGVICYIPANATPMLITRTLVTKQDNTIVGGAVEIAKHGDVLIALVVLVASVMIPVGKFLAIAYLALTLRRGTVQSAHGRQVLYEVVDFIGRWSMIDVFVVAILSALVQLSVVASIRPGPAALTFALSVIFTMLSAQSFDSRLIWDEAQLDGPDTPLPDLDTEPAAPRPDQPQGETS